MLQFPKLLFPLNPSEPFCFILVVVVDNKNITMSKSHTEELCYSAFLRNVQSFYLASGQ